MNGSDGYRKHVFEDLKPYVCTIDGCEEPRTLYNHSALWPEHESSHLVSPPRMAECPFCAAIFQQRALPYFKHVSTHLQEVSLSVLPHPADEDDGFDSDDSNNDETASSAPSHPLQELPDVDTSSSAKPREFPSAGKGGDEPWQSLDPNRSTICPSLLGPSLAESAQHDPALGQIEAPSQTEMVQVLSEPADDAGPSGQGYRYSGSTSASTPQPDLYNPDEDDLLHSVIDRLLEVRGSRPGKQVHLLEAEIRYLCTKAREIFVSQPILLDLEAPIKVISLILVSFECSPSLYYQVCGDIHGQYYDLLRIFEYAGFPPEANFLFLGNYVDYGKQSLETMCLLLAYKIKYPENFFLLRGSHEYGSKTKKDGFYDECRRRYNTNLWKLFVDLFNYMPVAAIIDEKIFAVHGGLSPHLNTMDQIKRIMRPTAVSHLYIHVHIMIIILLRCIQVGLGPVIHMCQYCLK